ncbi:MAG: phosphatidylserine decarboxylase, partial [Pseudomonadales bacterium]
MSQTFAALQRLLPQHGLSRLTGYFAASQAPWIRRSFIRGFARAYPVDMTEAVRESLDDYHSFNDFFTRELKPGARPLPTDPLLAVSP